MSDPFEGLDLQASMLRYVNEALARSEHTDPITGERIVLEGEAQERAQALADLLAKEDVAE